MCVKTERGGQVTTGNRTRVVRLAVTNANHYTKRFVLESSESDIPGAATLILSASTHRAGMGTTAAVTFEAQIRGTFNNRDFFASKCEGRWNSDETLTPKDVPQGASTLAFVFDITGSMYDDLVQVIDGAAKILETTLSRKEKPLYNYALVPFHDPDIGPVIITTDPEEFQQQLRELYVQGGGDCPEMSVGAIKKALEISLPSSFIYVFTDARSKDYYLKPEALRLIQEKQSQSTFLLIVHKSSDNLAMVDCGNRTHPGYRAFEDIAATSSGQVFHLEKKDVNQVLNFVRVSLQARKVNLVAQDHNQGGIHELVLPVDNQLREITVSVSGQNPAITVKDPTGLVLSEGNGLTTLLQLESVLVVNVKAPMPGPWTLKASSTGLHTLRVTGLSSLDFTHGFSRKPTRNITAAASRPILEELSGILSTKASGMQVTRSTTSIPTYVVVNATGLIPPGVINKLELINLQGLSLIEVPVFRHPEQHYSSLYNVSGILPPEGFFYLRVSGVDVDNFIFQRITPSALNAEIPAEPVVSMAERQPGYYEQTATVVCNVQSVVPFTVQWSKDGKRLGSDLYFRESTNVTWEILDVSIAAEGMYECKAFSIAGVDKARTFLDVREPPPIIVRAIGGSAPPGGNTVLSCIVTSETPFNLTWKRDGKQLQFLLLPHMEQLANGSLKIQ
ncbi:Hemicentin-1, partial [Branchiostoma belcheri]